MITTDPIWSIVCGDTLIAEADSLDGILLAARTIRDETEEAGMPTGFLDELVVMKAGVYDAAATGAAQTGWM